MMVHIDTDGASWTIKDEILPYTLLLYLIAIDAF
jgi:hypothetical protein